MATRNIFVEGDSVLTKKCHYVTKFDDRLAMLICGADSLRDVTAFPKVQNASELMSGAPSYIDDIQLDELGINITKEEKDEQ